MSILNIFENKKLKEEFNTLQENYSLLEQKIKQKESEINSIKVEKIRFFNTISEQNKEIEQLETKVREMEIISKRLQEEKIKLEREIFSLKDKNLILENKNLELISRKQVLYREYSRLKEENLSIKSEEKKYLIVNLIKELKKSIFLKQNIKKSNEIKKSFEEKIHLLEKEKDNENEQSKIEFETKLNTVIREKNELIILKNQLEGRLLKKDRINERIKEELSKALKEKETLKNETLEIRREISEIEASFGDLEKELVVKNTKIQDLTIKLENLTWQKKEKESKLSEDERNIKKLENEKNFQKLQYDILEIELKNLKKSYTELKSQTNILEEQFKAEKNKNLELYKEIDEYKAKLKSIQETKVNTVDTGVEIKAKKTEIEETPIKLVTSPKEDNKIIIPMKEQVKKEEVPKIQPEKKADPVLTKLENAIKKQNSTNLKWDNYKDFLNNRFNLIEFLKTFSSEDFQNIFFQVKDKRIIKKVQEKFFSNILIRLKLKLPLTNMDIEKIIPLYKELMEILYEEGYFEKKIEAISNSNNDLTVNENISEATQAKEEIQEEPISLVENNDDITETDVEEVEVIERIENSKIETLAEPVTNTIKDFNDLLNLGIKTGEINIEDLKNIDYENEVNVYDIYEAIEILEERGIRIIY